MTWHLTTDPEGEPTLWHGDKAVLRRHDLAVATWGVRTPGDRREYEALLDRIWDVLTRVLAPDEATVERLVDAFADVDGDADLARGMRAVLAALAAAPDPDGGKDEGVSG